VNPHYEKMLGTAGRSVIGGDESDLLGEEETRQIRSNEATVLATGEARRFEESIRMRDGTVRTYVSVKVPLRGVDGTIEGVCGVSTDITELRLREEELRDSEERLRSSERLYRAIGESIDYGVWICDATGRNVYTSESMLRLIGITQEECSGLGWTSALHPDEAAATRAAWERCVAEGSFWEREQRFRRTDGTWRHVLTRGIPIRDDAGRVTAWAGINLDVDAFKRAQEALEESDRRKDEFLAMLSHELRNPLNAVVGATSLLDRLAREDEGTARAREVIARQTRHLTRLLDDLLDVTRVTSGKIILQREPMRLDRVVEECVATFRLEGRASGQDLVFSADQPVWVSADRTRIEQVISNLLVNAVKYTPHGGTIRVSVGRRGEEAELEVADTGAGLPSDLLPRVFDLFVQGDRTVDRAQGGLGIGLTLVKRIAELHDGTVSAASTGPGDGSVFTVRLPALVREPVVERAPAVETPARRRILVVEDHEDSRVTLRQFLELDGHEVREAGDGRAGLRIALDWRPDVALVDLGLPEMDGLELAEALRAAGDPQPYLIALTGYGRPEDVRRAQDAGFRAHLTKPFEPASLARVLAESAMSRGVEVRSAADTSSTAPD
jgi:PAS domain S-box-containing protein